MILQTISRGYILLRTARYQHMLRIKVNHYYSVEVLFKYIQPKHLLAHPQSLTLLHTASHVYYGVQHHVVPFDVHHGSSGTRTHLNMFIINKGRWLKDKLAIALHELVFCKHVFSWFSTIGGQWLEDNNAPLLHEFVFYSTRIRLLFNNRGQWLEDKHATPLHEFVFCTTHILLKTDTCPFTLV